MAGSKSPVLAAVLLFVGAVIATPLFAGEARSQQPSGAFACRGSPANLLGLELVIANSARTPCAPDAKGIGSFPPAPSGAEALTATTHVLPDNGGVIARTTAMGIDVPLLGDVVSVGLIQSEAAVRCEGGAAQLSSSSRVQGLSVGGQALADDEPRTISLVIGELRLNHVETVGNTVTVRPVWLKTALGDIILGEAQVGFDGNPCAGERHGDPLASLTIVKEADPATGEFSFDGDLGPFTLAPGTRRTFALFPGTYRVRELPVTFGFFRDQWVVAGLECTDTQAVADIRARSLEVRLDPGERVVCTVRNFNPRGLSGVLAATIGGEAESGVQPERRQLTNVGVGGAGSAVVPPPNGDGGPPPTIKTQKSGLSGAVIPLIGLPLLLGLGALLWFLLAAGRRRDEEGRT